MQDGNFGIDALGEYEQAPALLAFNLWAVSLNLRF